ncbi:hypothetical protein F8388_023679 [Cannabis sativa]|uniref:Uncharacterized protein n=1 Tax=Cannabis sativa TaxID=3483 RepID=A0A7J6GA14_CANSA|nr:hypothetical protein F8388_023679 [Cannabis sativa]
MYLSKRVIVVVCIISLFYAWSSSVIDGRYIGYGTIIRDENPGCSVKHPENCMKRRHPDNPYQRGCLKEDRCREDNPPRPRSRSKSKPIKQQPIKML